MDFKSLQRKAKQLIDRRGGTDSVKADAEELKDIAKGPGSVTDKAKRAGDALKDPGAKGPDTPASPRAPAPDTPTRLGRRSPAIRPAPSHRSDDALLLRRRNSDASARARRSYRRRGLARKTTMSSLRTEPLVSADGRRGRSAADRDCRRRRGQARRT